MWTKEDAAQIIIAMKHVEELALKGGQSIMMSYNLPDPVVMPFPEVRMRREKVQEFRDNYEYLLAFAAAVLGKAPKDVKASELTQYLFEKFLPKMCTKEAGIDVPEETK